nr:hypothetical protein [Thaumasiovibrio subtropicus]
MEYDEVFFEHPSGEFNDSLNATIAAIVRLYEYENVDRWLTLSAQGIGYINHPVKVKRPYISVEGEGINVSEILINSGIGIKGRSFSKTEDGLYNLKEFSAVEVGKIIHSIYVNHYNVKPFPGDPFFGVVGEWL